MKAATPGIGVTFARARSRGRNNPPDAQAGSQLAAQYFRTLNEQRLKNGLMVSSSGKSIGTGYVEGVGLAVAVTAGFQRIVGHNDEAGGVYRVHNGHGTAFANEYSHFRFTPFIGATGSATAIALGYYREYFHACDDVLCGLIPTLTMIDRRLPNRGERWT
jgi:hypothetical protein